MRALRTPRNAAPHTKDQALRLQPSRPSRGTPEAVYCIQRGASVSHNADQAFASDDRREHGQRVSARPLSSAVALAAAAGGTALLAAAPDCRLLRHL
jgi:hypothetical protein